MRFNAYIVWEITKLFVTALTAFTTVIMLFVLTKELLTQGLGILRIVELIPYALPASLQYALPATLLFAVCSVYGRISADNEILAVTAAGVSPLAIIKPTLVASFLISILAVWLNDVAVSWGTPGINRVVMHSIEEVAYRFLASQNSYTGNQGFSIHVHEIGPDDRELILPTIKIPQQSGPPMEIKAQSARLEMDAVAEVLRIELKDSEILSSGFSGQIPGSESYEIRLSEATKKGTASGRAADIAIRDLKKEHAIQKLQISENQEKLAARTAMGLATGKLEWLNDATSIHALGAIEGGQHRLTRLAVEPWRRWAFGFICLFFVWVGVPLSIWMKSADHWTSFGACFLPILLVFFPVFAIGLGHAKDGSWPPVAVWLGNAMLLVVGAWWLRKVYRS